MVSTVAQTFDLQMLWHCILGRKNRALLLESSCSVSEAGASSRGKAGAACSSCISVTLPTAVTKATKRSKGLFGLHLKGHRSSRQDARAEGAWASDGTAAASGSPFPHF